VTPTHRSVPPNLPPSRCSLGRALQGCACGSSSPVLSPGLGMLQKRIQAPALGWHRAQTRGFSLGTLSQGLDQQGWVSHRLGDGFFRGNAAFLHRAPLSPRRTEWGEVGSSPLAGDLNWAVSSNRSPQHRALRPQAPTPRAQPNPDPRPRAEPRCRAPRTARGHPALQLCSLQKPRPRNLGTPKTCAFLRLFFSTFLFLFQ